MKTLTIDGFNIRDIASLYEEINRVFMQDEDWKLGESLDALNDLFYGGFGAIKGNEQIQLIWKNYKANKKTFSLDLTLDFYRQKLKHPEVFNTEFIQETIADLEAGKGKTYFEIVEEIIGDHPNIELVKA